MPDALSKLNNSEHDNIVDKKLCGIVDHNKPELLKANEQSTNENTTNKLNLEKYDLNYQATVLQLMMQTKKKFFLIWLL